ncbi:hypothetical protein IVB22_39790 [Bradyrhizobium sp. 190]|uniref:hypothetical protein n=1 Tax=Bradyrhizobium sp. 190 TaxID=2782658 RepID=UPI001FFB62FC|nr:hypothetical protein [Bradyrhizobium sp. 190]MCK1518509.1 hypothetical protein [Bradyrhizobium sp. 190]
MAFASARMNWWLNLTVAKHPGEWFRVSILMADCRITREQRGGRRSGSACFFGLYAGAYGHGPNVSYDHPSGLGEHAQLGWCYHGYDGCSSYWNMHKPPTEDQAQERTELNIRNKISLRRFLICFEINCKISPLGAKILLLIRLKNGLDLINKIKSLMWARLDLEFALYDQPPDKKEAAQLGGFQFRHG